MVRVGTKLAALEMIQSGTTTFTDMYVFEEEIAGRARDAGLRGVLGETSSVSGRRREDACGRFEARRSVHRGVQARPADHAGRGAALWYTSTQHAAPVRDLALKYACRS